MKLSVLCCTYLRPEFLGQLIESYRRQDYPINQRELVILDDAGQYSNQSGEGWRLISIPSRFRTLGEKRNACAALASPDSSGFVIADDDDIYLPHWLSTHATALRKAEWSRPGLVYQEQGDVLREHPTGGFYHANWAYRREAFDRVRGYKSMNNREDQDLGTRFTEAGVTQFDPSRLAPPFFIHRPNRTTYHVSCLDDTGYAALANLRSSGSAVFRIGWPRDYLTMPRIPHFEIGSSVSSSKGKRPVELIRPVPEMGRSGPFNAFFSIQQELLRRIGAGLDWLSIRSTPVSRGALPWFWNWQDREYASWWDAQNLPFVQGPYMLFLNSNRPRIDQLECNLLDARNCRGMFCNSNWYRDLIAKHRGPLNQSPITVCPSPIANWPEAPAAARYDLLIYSKNGHRPQLAEHLAEVFPRHIQINYGKYNRAELLEAARESRACAYLADDDHGPLALQEILLAGCPAVGVRTGAPFVQPGVTGFFVERLPPGKRAAIDARDANSLAEFIHSLEAARQLNRSDVRTAAALEFNTDSLINRYLNALEVARTD